MTILPSVVKAEYRGDYHIHLTFNDGTSKTVDFHPWLEGPVFEPLRDESYFVSSSWLARLSAGQMVPISRLRLSTRLRTSGRWHSNGGRARRWLACSHAPALASRRRFLEGVALHPVGETPVVVIHLRRLDTPTAGLEAMVPTAR
jgi:hypothetical protein